MTELRYPPPSAPARYEQRETGWTGWIVFASVMMVMVGMFQAIEGVVGIFKDGYFAVPSKDLLVTVDYTAWGWAHLGLGIVAIVTGIFLLTGRTWARIIAITLAVLSAIFNIGFLAAYPVWSTIIIAFDVLTIYAVAVHGGELRTD